MRVQHLIEAICTPRDDGSQYVIVVFMASKRMVNSPEGPPEKGMWFDVVGPFDDITRAEQQIVHILEEFKVYAYNAQVIRGELRDDIVITPTVSQFERDLFSRGYRRS